MDYSIEYLYAVFLSSSGVSIDTRTLKEGDMFFALKGEHFDAGEFVGEALDRGATCIVANNAVEIADKRVIKVQSPLKWLQNLSRFHRSKFKNPVVAITGSNGKTTTKELLYAVLSQQYAVHATKGNYNNHIGVPLTLLQITPQIEISIIEMGANHIGEIATLCDISQPTHGLITNIGRAHTEGFGGFEGVIKAKKELFDYLKLNAGIPFINCSDEIVQTFDKPFDTKIRYPSEEVKFIGVNPFVKIENNTQQIQTRLLGNYNYENIAAAIAIAKYFEVADTKIKKALEKFQTANSRSQLVEVETISFILDAYNANPDSMKAALCNLQRLPGRKMAILGDMNELEDEMKDHEEVLEYALDMDLEDIITVGEKFEKVKKKNIHFNDKKELIRYLKTQDIKNTFVLLKGSRTMQLESIPEEYLKRLKNNQ